MDYPLRTINRAKRAVNCSPFQMKLLAEMGHRSIDLAEVTGTAGVTRGYVQSPLAERAAERSLLWLIQVGLLRREVDGQGLTDSFRLTPLGRLLVEQWQEQGLDFQRSSWGDRLRNTGRRLLSGAL